MLEQKFIEKETLLAQVKKSEAEQRKRNVLIRCQGQLNPLIANNAVPCLDKQTMDRFNRKVEETEKIVKDAQELKKSASKYLAFLESNIEKCEKDFKALTEKSESLKKEMHSFSVKGKTDLLRKEGLKAEMYKIDEEVQSTEDRLRKVTEENKNYLSELECIISKRENYNRDKNPMKINITEKFGGKIESLEMEISIIDAKFEEFIKM